MKPALAIDIMNILETQFRGFLTLNPHRNIPPIYILNGVLYVSDAETSKKSEGYIIPLRPGEWEWGLYGIDVSLYGKICEEAPLACLCGRTELEVRYEKVPMFHHLVNLRCPDCDKTFATYSDEYE